MATQKGNEKIAKRRSNEWKKKLAHGKLDARMNPTQLRVKRVAKFLSQTDIAERAKLSLATYGAIERGFRSVKPTTAETLSKLLGASTKQLFRSNETGKLVASPAASK
jgi:transcriptional regulator with XRE-family HTH domain